MLVLIGSGISFDLTINSLEELKKADEIYVESYTNLISDDKDVLVQKLILGVPISCFVFEHGNLLHTNIKADDTAELTREDLITVRNDALYIHSVMAFSHHASYDFVMQIKNGKKQLYFLEANTHPSLMTDYIKESFGKSVKIQDYVRSKIT
jgi:D-alanine-D-alanine ligase-like ATP-grasp enzyme